MTDAVGAYSGNPQHTTTTAYNDWGRMSEVTDQLGATKYLYNNLGRKTEMIQPDPANGSADGKGPTTYYGYDADGNLKYNRSAGEHHVGGGHHVLLLQHAGSAGLHHRRVRGQLARILVGKRRPRPGSRLFLGRRQHPHNLRTRWATLRAPRTKWPHDRLRL